MQQYYIVEAKVLPEVFLKVAEAKRLLETGEVSTVHEATQRVALSRSAFYKYRDSILPFQNMLGGRILTFQFLLRDIPGLLSSILTIFADFDANILTIHQTIPTDGCASVTVSADTAHMKGSVEQMLRAFAVIEGVRRADILAG